MFQEVGLFLEFQGRGLDPGWLFWHISVQLAGDGQRRQFAVPNPPDRGEAPMKKLVYSLAVMFRVARADKLSVPYRYY
jgi:hypothetical protein